MEPHLAPDRVCPKFARCNTSKPNVLPAAWAVRADGPKSARILADALRLGGATRVAVVAGQAGLRPVGGLMPAGDDRPATTVRDDESGRGATRSCNRFNEGHSIG